MIRISRADRNRAAVRDAGKDAPKTGDQNFAGVCCMFVFAAAAATGMAVMAGRRRSDR